MLAGTEGPDGAVELAADETSPVSSDDSNHLESQGELFYTKEAKCPLKVLK